MQYVIIIAVAVVLLAIGCFISYKMGYENKRKSDEEKIGNAEQKAREIIDDALKTAEAKKREGLLEVKEESIRAKNDIEKETKERRAELQRLERRV